MRGPGLWRVMAISISFWVYVLRSPNHGFHRSSSRALVRINTRATVGTGCPRGRTAHRAPAPRRSCHAGAERVNRDCQGLARLYALRAVTADSPTEARVGLRSLACGRTGRRTLVRSASRRHGSRHAGERARRRRPRRPSPGRRFHVAAMVTLAMRQPGEARDSERLIAECGAAVITGLRYLVARHLETRTRPPMRARCGRAILCTPGQPIRYRRTIASSRTRPKPGPGATSITPSLM